jgi:hypothetical protein
MSKQQQQIGVKRKAPVTYTASEAPQNFGKDVLPPEQLDRIGRLLQVDLAESELSTRKGYS